MASESTKLDMQQADRQRVPDGWRELCRRLYVELFYCDQQMTSGKRPKWKQGETVRDVLADAKAALEAAAPEAPAHGNHFAVIREMVDEAPAQAKEISPEFTDTARAALLWVLWHHQGGSSDVGQPIRFALGMGQYEKMNAHQVREAKRWAALNPKPTHEAPAQASAVDERAAPEVTEFNVGRWCLSEDDCIEQGIDFAAYERGVADAATAFGRNRARVANGIGGGGKR